MPIAAQNPYDGNLQQGAGSLIYPAVTGSASAVVGAPQHLFLSGALSVRKFGTVGAVSLPVTRRGFASIPHPFQRRSQIDFARPGAGQR